MKTIESKTADAILQSKYKIIIGGTAYNVAPPTAATLIAISKYISTLPSIEIVDKEKIIYEALAHAKDCEYLGTVLAILILGSKEIGQKEVVETKYILRVIPRKIRKTVNPVDELSKVILDNLSPREIFEKMVDLLECLNAGFFLNTIIFLRDVNLLKKTKN